ncbi:DNA repair endonuclease XPF [Geodia barretti]|uniref:DNA repair endonuclease XPF n=1 Tax=Geodia barretti TaxID=519541 RepID=A0AA35RF33_GEOBA|nr:DNA repair endonuclease XPF [Geodia barretti]
MCEVQLDFENQMFIELLAQDGMVVLARGLGLERLFLKFLKLYSDHHQLVLVLNTSPAHQGQYMEELLREKVDHLPRSITNEVSVKERETVYQRGGVVFITSRILVVDLLRGQCPVAGVSGLLIWSAHKVTETSSEAFIIRLFRESSKSGFVKAFSDSPEQFMSGFCQLERVMRCLFLRHLYLWPRYYM